MTFSKTFIFIFLTCFNLFIQQAHAERNLLGYFHLIHDMSSPFGELTITETDTSGKSEILFRQFPISLEMPENTDHSYNEVLIATICAQMSALVEEYDVQSINLFLQVPKINKADFESISQLNGLNLLSLINVKEIDRESLPYIERLKDSTPFFLNFIELNAENFDEVLSRMTLE